jgi:outer membrane protein OmpA-like peptidoglycan-associated protein
MKAEQNKNRVTVYYLLAEHFGKLALFHGVHGHRRGWGGWVERCGCRRCGLFWFVLVLILLLLLGLLYLGLHKQKAAPSAARPVPSAAVTAPTAIPSGAGVMSEVQDGKPVVIVYFDMGKATLSPDFETTAKLLRSFLNEHPASKLAISGYNDATGDSVRNAELSKERAQAVQAALVTANIPMMSIELLKPMNTTDIHRPDAQARRVEVRVK